MSKRLLPICLFVLSLLFVAFGQPIWHWSIGLVAGTVGFALFWSTLLDIPSAKTRFWTSALWFSCVQLIQLFWLSYHPYSYIYIVYVFFAFAIGLQFGFIGLLMTRHLFTKWIPLLGVAGLWTLMEWSRLFFLSGYTWNPVGLALAGTPYALQAASLFGVLGLSFWVIFVNLAALRAWLLLPRYTPVIIWLAAALLPLFYGMVHLSKHEAPAADAPKFRALLLQPAFPAEEALEFKEIKHYVAFVIEEWIQLLNIAAKHAGKDVDLIALPEYVVPFGTYSYVYPYEVAAAAFKDIFGPQSARKLPRKEWPFAKRVETTEGAIWAVNNAFWAQALANIFEAPIVAGLEDAQDVNGQRERYSAALYFMPMHDSEEFQVSRYAKRVLVPMAEYIPFTFCRALAARYGIQGSFTCGQKAHVFHAGSTPFGLSICYEETFGDIIRESCQQGAKLLVNLTSDVWFPHSLLPYQHLEHSRLRTVENGVPLLRACNTGITCGIDSLGNTVALLGETREQQEWSSDSLFIEIPLYSHPTLYTQFGDLGIVATSLIFSLAWLGFSLLKIDPIF